MVRSAKYKSQTLPPTFKDDDTHWGHKLQRKEDNYVRITSENIDHLGLNPTNNIKQEKAREWLISNDVDISCWQEVGINWSRVKRKDKLSARMNCKAWDNIRVSTSHNRNEYYERGQYGGTATISLGTLTGTIHDTGQDPTGLGRWSYITYLGRNRLSSCVISAYNPCKTKITAPQTVYAQHSRYFLSNNIDTCPREMFRKDLSGFIESLEKEKI